MMRNLLSQSDQLQTIRMICISCVFHKALLLIKQQSLTLGKKEKSKKENAIKKLNFLLQI